MSNRSGEDKPGKTGEGWVPSASLGQKKAGNELSEWNDQGHEKKGWGWKYIEKGMGGSGNKKTN